MSATHIYYWKKYRPEWKDRPCRVLSRGRKNSVKIEFEDGEQAVVSRFAVRLRNRRPGE